MTRRASSSAGVSRSIRFSRTATTCPGAIPASATQIRLVASDDDLAPQHWIAVTPPRIPKLRTLHRPANLEDLFLKTVQESRDRPGHRLVQEGKSAS